MSEWECFFKLDVDERGGAAATELEATGSPVFIHSMF